MLLEPKFLRYHNLLEDHFGYRQGDQPGAAYLEQWQELKRNMRHMNRFQKREKLRELNKMFEANKGKFEIYPTVRYTQLGDFNRVYVDIIWNFLKAHREIMTKYPIIQIGEHTVGSSQRNSIQFCSFDR